MRILLDTNILVPLLDDEVETLPRALADVVEANIHDFYASAASLWEMAIKARLGKLLLPCTESELPTALERMGVVLLPLSPVHATTQVDPWPETNDPFDRVLLSVCAVDDLALMTTDRELRGHPLAWRA